MAWPIVGAMAVGTIASMISEKQKADAAKSATRRSSRDTKYYWQKSQWTPERRSEMMKGVQGFIAKYVTAGKERTARTGADLGRGGGYYGGEVERTRRMGLGIGAQELAKTWTPPAMPSMPQQYLSTGTGQTMDAFSQMGGQIGGTYAGFRIAKHMGY